MQNRMVTGPTLSLSVLYKNHTVLRLIGASTNEASKADSSVDPSFSFSFLSIHSCAFHSW